MLIKNANISKINIKKADYYLSNYVVVYFVIQALNQFINYVIGGGTWWFYISRAVLLLFLTIASYPLLKRNVILSLFSFTILLLCFLYTIIIGNTDNSYFYTIMSNCLVILLPLGLCVYSINDLSILLRRISFVSVPCAILLIMASVLSKDEGYSMTVGYALLFWTFIIFEKYLSTKKIINLLLFMICSLDLLFYGSRGAIACLGIYLIIKLFFSEHSLLKKIIIIILIIVAVTLFIIYQEAMLTATYNFANSLGFHARTIRTMIIGTLTDTSSRSSTFSYYLNGLNEQWVFGRGLVGAWMARGSYPHNIFLELLYSFGIPLGILLILMLIILIIYGFGTKRENERILFHVFFSLSCLLFLCIKVFTYTTRQEKK